MDHAHLQPTAVSHPLTANANNGQQRINCVAVLLTAEDGTFAGRSVSPNCHNHMRHLCLQRCTQSGCLPCLLATLWELSLQCTLPGNSFTRQPLGAKGQSPIGCPIQTGLESGSMAHGLSLKGYFTVFCRAAIHRWLAKVQSTH